jgi:Txe/YoeB family toxin of Txe-Axe toxin-antitoxin module
MNLLIKDNENSLTIKGDLIDVAKNVLEKTEKFCKKLKSSIYPLISHKTDEYDEDRYIARSIDIDKNNRFVYRVNLDNNTIEILEVMFHNNRELLKESITQQIMMKMLYDIYKSKERIKFINYIYKIFDKLKLEEKPPSMEIRKIIPNKNPRRFNSGKELYDFIDKISINIKEIKRFMNNH